MISLYLNYEKFWPLDIHSFKDEVELQLRTRKKIKVVRCDSGEYYGIYDIRYNVWNSPCVFLQ